MMSNRPFSRSEPKTLIVKPELDYSSYGELCSSPVLVVEFAATMIVPEPNFVT